MTKREKIIFGVISILVISLLVFYMMNRTNDKKEKVNQKSENVSSLMTVYGNTASKAVIINVQGGPFTELSENTLQTFIEKAKAEDLLFVNVEQAQTLNPEKFKNKNITFEEAKEYDEQTVEYLHRVIEVVKKKKGKKVYILGISFGAFVTEQLIAKYGIDVADGYLIMVGRLDINEKTWKNFSQGKYMNYIYDKAGNYTIEPLNEKLDTKARNMSRLAAGLGYHRYTDSFENIKDLSKITYIYGEKDEQVGKLSAKEIKFLEDRNATVISFDKNHENTFMSGVAEMKKLLGLK